MPSMRRMRVFGVIVFTVVVYVLYLTHTSRPSHHPEFYSRTKNALDELEKSAYLDRKPGHPRNRAGSNEDEELAVAMSNRLKDAEKAAKQNANGRAPTRESVMGSGKAKPLVEDLSDTKAINSAPERKKKKKYPTDDGEEKQKVAEDTADDQEIEAELNSILKRSPIIIFSKSYCPHSTRAKHILLEMYSIVPAPFVVELDQHPLGLLLQARLAEMTGRSTVPNVLISGKSIGGGDDVAELDMQGTLIDTVKKMGGKRMQEVTKVA